MRVPFSLLVALLIAVAVLALVPLAPWGDSNDAEFWEASYNEMKTLAEKAVKNAEDAVAIAEQYRALAIQCEGGTAITR